MSHCVVVSTVVVQPQILVPLVAGAAVGAAVGAIAATAVEARRRARASRAFRVNILNALDDLNEQGINVEDAELAADSVFELDCDDGTTLVVKKLPAGQYQLIGPQGGAVMQSVLQQYTYEAAKTDLTAEGFNVVAEEVDDHGAIKLLARRWGNEREEVEALIPARGPMQYQGFGMPPSTCGDTIERLALRMGHVEERHYHTEETLQTLRLFPAMS